MTVYVRQVASSLAARGIEVDIFTRRNSLETPPVSVLSPGVRVFQIQGGQPDLAKEDIPAHLPEFTANLVRTVDACGEVYDVIHSHYWLSGRVASVLADRWSVPFVHTFHTLGREKNRARRPGELEEPEGRLQGEARVIADACAIIASTIEERRGLVELYAAHPERIHLVPPGVDHQLFRPADREQAKAEHGLAGKQVILFVGRLQPLKAADTAIRAFGLLVDWGRVDLRETRLVIVGGSSGPSGAREGEKLAELARTLRVEEGVSFVPAQPHSSMPGFFQAADVCLVPSYSESFGLVALEAQACGVPVIGSAVGGLKSIVRHGQTGFLVQPGNVESFAERAWRVLSDASLARSMSRLAVCSSEEFSWDRSAGELHDIYSAGVLNGDCTAEFQGSAKKLLGSRTIIFPGP